MTSFAEKINLKFQFVFIPVILFSFSLYLVSCSNTESKTPGLKNTAGILTDTLIIDIPAAVIYNPDSLKLEKIKATTEPMAFESNTHECIYLLKFSRNELQNNWPKIKIVETGNAGYILFKTGTGNKELIDLNSRKDFCGIFLFDGHKKAHFADLANIATELGFYFSKK